MASGKPPRGKRDVRRTPRKPAKTTKTPRTGRKKSTSPRKKSASKLIARIGKKQLDVATAFPALLRAEGHGALVVIADRADRKITLKAEAFERAEGSTRGGGRGAARRKITTPAVCTTFAALGHPKRAAILAKLLEGPCIYRALRKVTGLGPGPLYHHINQLRLAGLMISRERNLYELTSVGRTAILIAQAIAPLLKQRGTLT